MKYDVMLSAYSNTFIVEVEFDDEYKPSDSELQDKAEQELISEIENSKLEYWRKLG